MVAATTWLRETTDALARRLREEQAVSREEAAAVVSELEKVKARNREVGTQLAGYIAEKEAAERRINDAEHLLQTTRESVLRLEQQEAVATVSVVHKDAQLSLLARCVTLLEQQARLLQKHQEDRDQYQQDVLRAKEHESAAQDVASKLKTENQHLLCSLDEMKRARVQIVEEINLLRRKLSDVTAAQSRELEHDHSHWDVREVQAVQGTRTKETHRSRCNISDADSKQSKRPMELTNPASVDCKAAETGTRDQGACASAAIVKEGLQDDSAKQVATGSSTTLADESSKDVGHNQQDNNRSQPPPAPVQQGDRESLVMSKPGAEAGKHAVSNNKPETMLCEVAEKQNFQGVELAGKPFEAAALSDTKVVAANTAASFEQAARRKPEETGAECKDPSMLRGMNKGLPAQAPAANASSSKISRVQVAQTNLISGQLSLPAPWKSTAEAPSTKSQQHPAELQNHCQECGHRKRTFRDANDNMHYCQECWIHYYGQPPGSSAVVARTARRLLTPVGQSATRPLPCACRKKRAPIFRYDLEKVGYTNGCRGCDAARAENPTPTSHTNACRRRIFAEMERLRLPAAKRLRDGGEVK